MQSEGTGWVSIVGISHEVREKFSLLPSIAEYVFSNVLINKINTTMTHEHKWKSEFHKIQNSHSACAYV